MANYYYFIYYYYFIIICCYYYYYLLFQVYVGLDVIKFLLMILMNSE